MPQTRYTHPSGLDLAEGDGFVLWVPGQGDQISYPIGWFRSASPEDIAALGFEKQIIADVAVTPPDALTIPLTRKQLRFGLLNLGFFKEQVDAVIAAIPSAVQREQARITWEESQDYERAHPLFSVLPAALGITTEQLDAEWRRAVNY